MSDYRVQQIRNTRNIEVRLNPEIVDAKGKVRLETLMIQDKKRKKIDTIPAMLLYAPIKATPHTDWLAGVAQRDAKGFIVTGQDVNLDASEGP